MPNKINTLEILALTCGRLGSAAYQNYTLLKTELEQDETKFSKRLEELSLTRHFEGAHVDIERWQGQGIQIVAVGSDQYPVLLEAMYQPPLVLFVRGALPPSQRLLVSLAIVGSRKADLDGCELAEQISRKLAATGITIVSGLALGIDSASHRGALQSSSDFPTVAVLGSGLNQLYPTSNRRLSNQILESGGLIFSQFEPDEPPYPVNFLKRNRVIAGLSQGTLVIQAGQRSGSLVTARFALEEGRDVFVTPGAIHDPRYSGSHELIKQGAYLVTSEEDILEAIPDFQKLTPPRAAIGKSETVSGKLETSIIEAVKQHGTVHSNELVKMYAKQGDINVALLELELAGILKRLPGNYWTLKS